MVSDLVNPDLPAGEIVEKRDDGTWVRRDGKELQPAEKNPFYVLATAYGPLDNRNAPQLLAKNRRIWNGWACARLDKASLGKLAKDIGLEEKEIEPLNEDEQAVLKAAFADRLGPDTSVPEAREDVGPVDFTNTYFLDAATFEKYVFAKTAKFNNSHFAGAADFNSAHFIRTVEFNLAHFERDCNFSSVNFARSGLFGSAYFRASTNFSFTHFGRYAGFDTTHFKGGVSFRSACFCWESVFHRARFDRRVDYTRAHFEKEVFFLKARFEGTATFVEGAFKGPVRFEAAQFLNQVPRFQQRKFHDDTNFMLSVTGSDGTPYWPSANIDVRSAQFAKNAYRRLRQVSASQYNPEAEHFFLRQEMACDVILKDDILSWFVVYGFGFISEFGYSVKRPLIALVGTWIFGSLLILFEFAKAHVYGVPPGNMDAVPGKMEAFGLGFANTMAIFGFRSFSLGEEYMVNLSTCVKIIGGFQTILGFIFLFFLGLGLRNRFRLK